MTDNPRRVFLIHGFRGNAQNHWFPWLRAELVARHFEVFVPSMPNPDKPIPKEWVNMISEWVGTPDENTILVGHSLGCIAIARYLESVKKGKIAGAVFVGGFMNSIGREDIESFTNTPIDAEKIKSRADKFFNIFSDDDERVPMNKSLELGKALGAKSIMEKGKGHFMDTDGVKSLPTVLECIIKIAQ